MAEILNLEQGSQEWLDARRQYRTASETPAVLGVKGAFGSKLDVRRAKRGIDKADNAAMAHGRDKEPIALAALCERTNMTFEPCVMVKGQYLASLDGRTQSGNIIAEIKCPFMGLGSKLWMEAAGMGEVPEHYWYQVQHQLMVSGADRAYFYVYVSPEHTCLLEVLPDPESWAEIRAAWDEFWKSLDEREDTEWQEAAIEFQKAYKEAEKASERLDAAKATLKGLAGGMTTSGGGVIVTRIEKAGSIDWKKVQAELLPEADIEPFRKPTSVEFRVSLSKE